MWVSMVELENIVGKDRANTLATHKGGVSFYVPVKADYRHELVKYLGISATQKLINAFAGENITVPNGKFEPKKEEIRKMLDMGFTKKEIARKCGVTERYVLSLAKDTKPEQFSLL